MNRDAAALMEPAPIASPRSRRPSLWVALRRGGTGLVRVRRLVFPLYLANLLTAVFAVLPLYLALHRLTAYRPTAEILVHQWDLGVLAELFTDHPSLVAQLQGTFMFTVLAYFVLSQLLLGGVLGALWRSGSAGGSPKSAPDARTFARDAAAHFWPLCWVLVWSALPLALTAGLMALGLGVTHPMGWGAKVGSLVPGALLWLWTDAALDFGRATTVGTDVTPSVRRLWRSFGLVLRRPGLTLGVHLAYGLLGLLPWAVLFLLPDSLDAGGTGAVLLAFLVRQVLVFLRVAIRVASLGSHLEVIAGTRKSPADYRQTP